MDDKPYSMPATKRFRRFRFASAAAAITVFCAAEYASSAAAAAGNGASPTDVLTYHNDLARTGQYLAETTLTPANVDAAHFGKVAFLAVDGKVDAQPLYVSGVPIGGTIGGTMNGATNDATPDMHNIVYVATEHGSLYAFDADTHTKLWQRSLLGPGERTSDNRRCTQITPEIGITSTPVIDRSRGEHGVIYAVAMSKDKHGAYHQRLHALDLSTGDETLGGPKEIAATYPGRGANSKHGVTVFDPKQYAERQALTLVGGNLYLAWTSHCDHDPYGGWVMAYSADTLAQTSVLNLTPNGSEGTVWMSGAGMASDGSALYFLDANGTFDTTLNTQGFPSRGDFGNAFLKLAISPKLAVADYFAQFNTVSDSDEDIDLGSGGALLLPDLEDANGNVRHLVVGAGKNSKIFVLDRDAMGKFNRTRNAVWQEVDGQLVGGVYSMPAYYGNVVYYGAVGDSLRAFPISSARLAETPSSKSDFKFPYPGATPSVSANGSRDAIVWAAENGRVGALHAFDASDLGHELYNSNQSGSRDRFGPGNKFITPMIAHGHVYVGATNGVAVFGLLQ
ncbi:PQQ-binding-like beta-propeller repeat protein [Trinickia acidisoli]|uniref:PQQ-binding-like beta-propeller repeat protein n=1 Tax=Trinickia acidisoli TaxID=2767482 RepID=UPI001A8F918A|nr:PQQ-binding-like beta-propeller repeat protein [Trinickia acidisoli]